MDRELTAHLAKLIARSATETMIYDVESGEPVWAGRSETTNPDELSKAISDLCRRAR